jgi:hypothetical protein
LPVSCCDEAISCIVYRPDWQSGAKSLMTFAILAAEEFRFTQASLE